MVDAAGVEPACSASIAPVELHVYGFQIALLPPPVPVLRRAETTPLISVLLFDELRP